MGAAVRGVEGAGGAGGEMSLRGTAFWWAVPLFFTNLETTIRIPLLFL